MTSTDTLKRTLSHLDEGAVDATQLFDMIDTNGDGSIERSEFARMYTTIKQQARLPAL